jgi:hypothetical protein
MSHTGKAVDNAFRRFTFAKCFGDNQSPWQFLVRGRNLTGKKIYWSFWLGRN